MNDSRETTLTKIAFVLLFLFCFMTIFDFFLRPKPLLKINSSKDHFVLPSPKPFEFPQGGRQLYPDYRFIALYGTPNSLPLGALGEQPLADSIARVKALADQYRPLVSEHIYPTFEIIASVASKPPTEEGDYSQPANLAELRPWVETAKKEGVYVLLDLQPGRNNFLTQAKIFEPLLKEPHVGLALDPEWRLGPTETHLNQIGHVSAAEINQTATWLADLTKKHDLPQKLFLAHQFRLSMIEQRELLDGSRPELSYVIQMDGHGDQKTKLDTYATITATPPAGYQFGWKNFYDEDLSLRTPHETMSVNPPPRYVSYQ